VACALVTCRERLARNRRNRAAEFARRVPPLESEIQDYSTLNLQFAIV